MSFESELAELSLQYFYRHSIFQKTGKTHEWMIKFYKDMLRRSKTKGVVEHFYKNDRLYAFLIIVTFKNKANGEISTRIFTNYRPNSPQAKSWWLRTLRKHLLKCKIGTSLPIAGHMLKDLKLYKSGGFFLDAVRLIGETQKSMKILKKKNLQAIRDRFEKDNYKIIELSDPKLAKPLAELVVREFKKRPWHCRFAAHDAFIKSAAKNYRTYANKKDTKEFKKIKVWVIIQDKKPLGVFSASFRDDPLFDKVAGLDFGFDESLQGKGIGLLAYHKIFDWLIKNKITYYQGHTSNPAVLHLARQFKRVPVQWELRKGKPHYSEKHFQL